MKYTVDIDTGGTMTDALVSDGHHFIPIKTDTTPHDFTVSFVECLKVGAEQTGYGSVSEFLEDVSIIRWTSTITTNILAQRAGSKVGLIVQKGHELDLYGDQKSVVVDELVSRENIIGLPENLDTSEIMAAVKDLLEDGVRRICISLDGSFPDNSAEAAIKKVIEDQYPDHILGSVPVLLGSEMAQLSHDQTRAHYALINNYTHTGLASSLFKAEDILKYDYGFDRPLLIGHTSGGVAKIAKTKSVDTIESGPIFGTFAGAFVANAYNKPNVLCFDVGGTTAKASIVKNGEPVYQRGGELMGVPVRTTFAMLRSAAVGGGSIARAKPGGGVTLGPDSMGAAPGPACYGLGGDQATLTDCLLLLGYLDGNNFLGGQRQLSLDNAATVIDQKIAQPLGVSIEKALLMIRDEAVRIMKELVIGTLNEGGVDPQDTSLYAFGGNGPMFAAFVAEALGMTDVTVFNYGPVFSAFGSAMSDVVHVYERGLGSRVPMAEIASSSTLREAIKIVKEQADRDLLGEGHDLAKAKFELEVEYIGNDGETQNVKVSDIQDFGDDLIQMVLSVLSEENTVGAELEMVRLSSRYQVAEKQIPLASNYKERQIQSSERGISFGPNAEDNGNTAYNWESLKPGDQIPGPAVVGGSTITCPVPPGWSLIVDKYANACLTNLPAA